MPGPLKIGYSAPVIGLTTRTVSVLFFLSGAASLIYQVVWMRMLIRVFGVTTLAVSTIIAVFMGGLSIGAWLGGRRSTSDARGLRTYSRLEIGAALAGSIATAALIAMPGLYASLGVSGAARTLVRILLSSAALLPPTILMGATLPVLTRFVAEREKGAGFGLAILYGWNTLGAVAGVLLSGFVLLAALGEIRTVAVAVSLNLACALGAGFFAARAEASPEAAASTEKLEPIAVSEHLLLWLFFFSGFGALGLEVLWSRLIVLLVGSSVYAYALLLAAVLSGIGIGGLLSAVWLRKNPDRQRALEVYGGLQIAIAFSTALGLVAYKVVGLIASDYRFLFASFESPADIARFALDCWLVVFPASILMGLSFPLAGPLLARSVTDAGRAAGRAFAFNTMGGVIGSAVAGFILVPLVGTSGGVAIFVGLAGCCGLIALSAAGAAPRARRMAGTALVAAALFVGWSWNPSRAILENRLGPSEGTVSFHHEQTAATVTGWASKSDHRSLLLNGITVSGRGVYGQAMALIPMMLRPATRRMLVVCFGAGNTFRTAARGGIGVDAVDLVEGVFDSFPWFWEDAHDVLAMPNAQVHVDDGRHYLLTTERRYGVIVVDGSPPVWSARTVNLYTREFVDLAKNRLTEKEGVLAIWVPVPMLVTDLGVILRNFSDAFEHIAMWSYPGGPGFFIMGSDEGFDATPIAISKGYKRLKIGQEAPGLSVRSVVDGFPIPEAGLKRIAGVFPPLTDDRPYTEFPLGPLLRGDRLLADTSEIVRRLIFIGKQLGGGHEG